MGARDPMYDGRMPWSFLRHWIGRMLKTPAWCLWGSQREVFAAGLCGRHSFLVELNGGPSRAHCGPCKCLVLQLTYSATDLPCLVWRLREAMALEEALEAMALLRLEPIRTNPGPAMLQIHKVGATRSPQLQERLSLKELTRDALHCPAHLVEAPRRASATGTGAAFAGVCPF